MSLITKYLQTRCKVEEAEARLTLVGGLHPSSKAQSPAPDAFCLALQKEQKH